MGFQRKSAVTLVTCLLVAFAGTAGLTSRLFIENTEKAETSQYELVKKIVEFNISGLETRALARAELVASMPAVKTMFAARDRDAMASGLKEMFTIQKEKFGVDQAQFHVPPGTSFLRLHNPTQFGDDLSATRPIVMAVLGDFVARKGMSISRSGPGVFGVSPVFGHDGKPIGSFEIGGDFGPVLDGVKRAYGLELVMFMDEERLKAAAPNLKDVYTERNRMGRFVKYKSTNWDLMQNLVTDAELSSPAIENEPFTREFQGTPYGVVAVPLRNPAGDLLGMIIAAKDFSPTRATLGQSMTWLAVYAVFAFVLMAGVVIVILRGAVARPLAILNQRFAALVAGGPAEPIEDTDGFYGEIGDLAEHYERLRGRADSQQRQRAREGAL
ncbi:MAG: hypothetical protein HQL41_17355 [Alphaproteobacteria bacterium]|nr:hypothetical protein [Alphaproteobacteria bacterium]